MSKIIEQVFIREILEKFCLTVGTVIPGALTTVNVTEHLPTVSISLKTRRAYSSLKEINAPASDCIFLCRLLLSHSSSGVGEVKAERCSD